MITIIDIDNSSREQAMVWAKDMMRQIRNGFNYDSLHDRQKSELLFAYDAYLHTQTGIGRKHPTNIYIRKDNPYYRMSYRGYISPARLAMAEHLHRCIGSDEYIYFKDGSRFNIDIDNLLLVSHKELGKLNRIRQVDRIIIHQRQTNPTGVGRLESMRCVLQQELDNIRHNNVGCRCKRCRRSIDARQAEYRL